MFPTPMRMACYNHPPPPNAIGSIVTPLVTTQARPTSVMLRHLSLEFMNDNVNKLIIMSS